MILAILAVVTATLQPAQPKVGDLITLTFAAPVTIETGPDYEVVSVTGNRVVLRTFEPKPFVVRGAVGGTHFDSLIIPVTPVLQPGDRLEPAPLAPPRSVPYPRLPFVAIAIAAACAAAVWALVWWRSRRRAAVDETTPPLTPEERFRRAVLALRTDSSHPERWAALADATRAYLAATRSGLGSELTTSELVPRLAEGDRVVADILRQGDLEKFSLRGPEEARFEEVAQRALELAS